MHKLKDFNADQGLSEIAAILKKIETTCALRFQSLEDVHYDERTTLLGEIFKIQSALERSLENEKFLEGKLNTSLQFIDRLSAVVPHRWLGSMVTIEEVSTDHESETLQWHVSDVFIGGRFFDLLKFKTKTMNSTASIEFSRGAEQKDTALFTRWPACLGEGNRLTVTTPKSSARDKTLSSFGPSDWLLIQEIVCDLLRYIEHSDETGNNMLAKGLAPALQNLGKVISSHPPVLRFDHISLIELTHNGGYHGLKLKLENVVQSGTHWEVVEYTLSTVDEAGESFGSHPRIEFCRVAHPFLSGWYPEQIDDDGGRFELRFEAPTLMDIKVWNSLPDMDKIRLVSLLSSLDVQFAELESQHPHVDWGKWRELGTCMKNIIAKTMSSYQKPGKI